jgi:hypothetical protein
MMTPTPSVSCEPLRVTSPDSTMTVEGMRLTFAGKVDDGVYDAESGRLIVECIPANKTKRDPKNVELVMYDVGQRKVLWSSRGNAQISALADSVAILTNYHFTKVCDAATGTFLREAEPGLQTLRQDGPDVGLCLTEKMYSRIDLTSGRRFWFKPGRKWHGYRWHIRQGDRMYVVADGLQSFSLEDGNGWGFDAPTYHSGMAEAIATDVALSVLGALAGGMYVGNTQAKQTHNLCSLPMTRGNRVYFAATKNVYCLDSDSGRVIWKADLPHELGTMQLRPAGPNVALIGNGWKYVNYGMVRARPPSVRLYNLESGTPAGEFVLEKDDVFCDFRWADSCCYFLTPSHLYVLAPDLTLKGALDRTAAHGEFLRFVAVDSELVIRTTNGLIAVAVPSLERIWLRDLGYTLTPEPITSKAVRGTKNWADAYIAGQLRQHDDYQCWSDVKLEWLPGTRGYVAMERARGGPIKIELPVSGTEIYVLPGGHLMSFDKNQVVLFDLAAQKL